MAALNAAKASTAVVVLGQSLNPDGSYPVTLSARVRAAADTLSCLSGNTPASPPVVILSGGDAAGVGVSEARCMLELLFPCSFQPTPDLAAEVLLEEDSLTTVANAAFCMPLLVRASISTVYLVSSDFHLPRALYIFEAVLAASGLRIVPVPAATPAPRPGDKGVNAKPLAERARDEVRFMGFIDDLMLRHTPPGFSPPIPTLGQARKDQAVGELQALMLHKQAPPQLEEMRCMGSPNKTPHGGKPDKPGKRLSGPDPRPSGGADESVRADAPREDGFSLNGLALHRRWDNTPAPSGSTADGSMATDQKAVVKTIILVRHAQSAYNAASSEAKRSDPNLRDAPLTRLGQQQAADLARGFASAGVLGRVELVVASPLRRAWQTAELAFGGLSAGGGEAGRGGGALRAAEAGCAVRDNAATGVPFVLRPEVAEALHASCDVPLPPEERSWVRGGRAQAAACEAAACAAGRAEGAAAPMAGYSDWGGVTGAACAYPCGVDGSGGGGADGGGGCSGARGGAGGGTGVAWDDGAVLADDEWHWRAKVTLPIGKGSHEPDWLGRARADKAWGWLRDRPETTIAVRQTCFIKMFSLSLSIY